MATVGIVANPAAGTDVRRLVAPVTAMSDAAKVGIVRRAVIGAIEAGATSIRFVPDRTALVERALDGLDVDAAPVAIPVTDRAADSVAGAAALRGLGCAAVVVLGGDGTHRDVTRGWPDVPMVAISTGTNNVFPRMVEATVAGAAAGLVAAGRVALADISARAGRIVVHLPGGAEDVALVDAVVVADRFTASRAVWDPTSLRAALFAVAEPDAVGLSSIGGLTCPSRRGEPGGTFVRFGLGTVLRAPIAPGLYAEVSVAEARPVALGEAVELDGPGALALDGEREHELDDGDVVTAAVTADGPFVIDPALALAAAGVVRVGGTRRRRTAGTGSGPAPHGHGAAPHEHGPATHEHGGVRDAG